jgi:YbbR domain-containing protein
LTELTDALVIVVSEERSAVTVFQDKSIIPVKDNIALNRLLLQYVGAGPVKNGARRELLELCLAGFICLTGVTTIWSSFARGVETFKTLDVPVEFVNRDPKMEIISASVSSVQLQISGSGSLIRSVSPDQVKVKINLANAEVGVNKVSIPRDGIALPPGIELKQLEPQKLEVNLDVPVRKNLPIQPDWAGKLPPGLLLQEARTIPETVDVRGGNQTLQNIQTIYTEKIPLDKITADGKITVDLVLQPSSLKLADEAPRNVEVIFKVAERSPPAGVEGK